MMGHPKGRNYWKRPLIGEVGYLLLLALVAGVLIGYQLAKFW